MDIGSPIVYTNLSYRPAYVTITIPDPQVNQISDTNVELPMGANAPPAEQAIYKFGSGVVRCNFQITIGSTGAPTFTVRVRGSSSNYEFAKFNFTGNGGAGQICSGVCGWCWVPDAVSGTNWSTIGGVGVTAGGSGAGLAATSVSGDFPIGDVSYALTGQFSAGDPANVASLNSCVFEMLSNPVQGLSTRIV